GSGHRRRNIERAEPDWEFGIRRIAPFPFCGAAISGCRAAGRMWGTACRCFWLPRDAGISAHIKPSSIQFARAQLRVIAIGEAFNSSPQRAVLDLLQPILTLFGRQRAERQRKQRKRIRKEVLGPLKLSAVDRVHQLVQSARHAAAPSLRTVAFIGGAHSRGAPSASKRMPPSSNESTPRLKP